MDFASNSGRDELEEKLTNAIGKDEMEKELSRIMESFHGFLTREVALKLLARKKGILKKQLNKIMEIKKGQNKIYVHGKLVRIWPVLEYKSGKKSRVVEIEDETGSIPLVLWNDDIDNAKNLRAGDHVEVENVYEKSGELHMGYSGSIKVTKQAEFTSLGTLPEGGRINVRGFVSRIEGGKLTPARLFVFFLSAHQTGNKNKEVRVVMWNNPERGTSLSAGDEIIIENALVKGGELQLYDDARLFTRTQKYILYGKLVSIEADGEELTARVDDKELKMNRNEALEFLDVVITKDIQLATVVNLKKDSMLNKRVAINLQKIIM